MIRELRTEGTGIERVNRAQRNFIIARRHRLPRWCGYEMFYDVMAESILKHKAAPSLSKHACKLYEQLEDGRSSFMLK